MRRAVEMVVGRAMVAVEAVAVMVVGVGGVMERVAAVEAPAEEA